jgi:hypothetical protein
VTLSSKPSGERRRTPQSSLPSHAQAGLPKKEIVMSARTTSVLFAAGVATAAALFPLISAPVAGADVCAGADGRHFAAGGCTDIAGDVATGAAIAAAHVPYVPGEVPCYTVEGVPYFTPPGDPC